MVERRPITVPLFELANVAIGVLPMLLGESESVVGDVITGAVWIGLTLWITRKRSIVGRRVYTVVTLLSVLALVASWFSGFLPPEFSGVHWLAFVASTSALLGLLWWPSSSAWLRPPSAHTGS